MCGVVKCGCVYVWVLYYFGVYMWFFNVCVFMCVLYCVGVFLICIM